MNDPRSGSGWGEPADIRSGADGVDDFICWLAAGIEFAVMVGSDSMESHRECPHCEPQAPIPGNALAGVAFGALALGSAADSGRHCRSRRPIFSRRSTGPDSISAGIPVTAAALRTRCCPIRCRPPRTDSIFSGVIGGVQAGYNVRLPSGLLLGVEADLTFPNYLHLELDRLPADDAAFRASSSTGLCRNGARPPRLRHRSLAVLRHRRLRLCRRALHQYARRRRRRKDHQRPARLGRRRRRRICLRAALERAARISLQPVRARQHSASRRARSIPPRSISSRSASASTARSTGRDRRAWTPKADLTDPESDRWEIHGQTTYLPQGYPAFRAPYTGTNSLTPARQAQATWSNSLYLNARLWEGGEVYYNPELLQGFGLNDTVGVAGFHQRRGAKVQLPLPALQHLAAVLAPDLRIRRRAGRTWPAAQRSSPARSTSTG